jgi:hypothetical protein
MLETALMGERGNDQRHDSDHGDKKEEFEDKNRDY